MTKILPVFVLLAVLVIFPVFIFYLLVRAIRGQVRWWGIVILLSILTCYCTTMVAVAGMIVGSNATGSAALEQRYCEQFCEVLKQTETLPEAIARMDAAAATDEYQIHEPDKNLRFRYVWLLGGCFLFAGANLMMFGPGRREKRHPADCIMMILAALVVFLTGIWQIAWGNGYAIQASAYRRMLTEWHEKIQLDAVHASNAEIATKLADDEAKGLNGLRLVSLELSGEKIPGRPDRKTDEGAGADEGANSGADEGADERAPAQSDADADTPAIGAGAGIAIIGGADGPTAVFIGSELLKRRSGATAENAAETGMKPVESE